MEILDLVRLTSMSDQPAGMLSFGQQKLLEIGRVLMARPKMILLDEPTAGINPTLIRHLVEIIRGLKERGIQIFLIEHNMPLVSEICEKIFVMDSGRLIFSGIPSDARRDAGVVEAYLGRGNRAP